MFEGALSHSRDRYRPAPLRSPSENTDTINAAMSAVVRRATLDEFTINDFDITDADLTDSRRDRLLWRDQADS